MAPDCKTVRLRVEVFGRDDPKAVRTVGGEFTAAVDPRTLTEAGVSYAHKKGAKDDADDAPAEQLAKLDWLRRPSPAHRPYRPTGRRSGSSSGRTCSTSRP